MAQLAAIPANAPQPKATYYDASGADVAAALGVNPETGLSSAEAASRLEQYGPNRFAEAATEPRWRSFVRQYNDPMQIVLLVAGIGSIWPLAQYGTGAVLLLLTVFNAVLGLHQEGKAAAAVAALQKMMIIKAKVRRDGELIDHPGARARPRRRRQHRGRRHRPGGRPAAAVGDARDRRVGADRRERAGLEGHRGRRRRRTCRSATAPTWSS